MGASCPYRVELPGWKLRRLVYQDGEWLCSLSKQPNMPEDIDETADAVHEVLPLAILTATKSQVSRWHWLSLIEEPNVARPEIELSRLLLGQVLIRQFDYRIGRNALPDLRDHLLNRNRRHPALSPPDARERNHNNWSAASTIREATSPVSSR
jgi:hypothetical protein